MIVFGKNTAFEVLNGKRKIYKVFVQDSFNDPKLSSLLKKINIQPSILPTKQMISRFGNNTQGIAIEIEDYQYKTLDDLIKKHNDENTAFCILDGLEDPHNLGAILRSADASGINGIIIPKNRSVGLTPTVAKVSTGAIEYVDVAQVTNLNNAIAELKKQGFWIIGLELDGSIDYKQQDYKGKIAVIIGSEGKGISRLVKENCDMLVNIPMYGKVNSLNASVSAALIFYEISRNVR